MPMDGEEVVIVPAAAAAATEQQIDALQEDADELEDVSEQLALHSIISEERHAEILERVQECQNRLDALSTAEPPTLAAIQRDLLELRSELQNLRSSVEQKMIPSIPTPSESETEQPANPGEPEPGESTGEPAPAAILEIPPEPPAPPKKKNRFI